MDLEQVRAIELALHMSPGAIQIASGYLPIDAVPREVETILRGDSNIHESLRDIAVAGYRNWVQTSRKINDAVGASPRRK